MKCSPAKTDHVAQVLTMIIEFTEKRDKLLTLNMRNANKVNYTPEDLDVTLFADLMGQAVSEHILNDRLIFRDRDSVQFGNEGNFDCKPRIDLQAKKLFDNDKKKYMELQVQKLSENMINHRIAHELLRQCLEIA